MANIYFGDGFSTVTGDWNTVSNWYSSPAAVLCPGGCCTCPTYGPGTPAGRVPAGGDTVILLSNVSTGPAGGWAGSVTLSSGVHSSGRISAGSYSGAIGGGGIGGIAGGTFAGPVNITGPISGGTFNAAASVNGMIISGGSFNAGFSGVSCTLNAGSYSAISLAGSSTLNGLVTNAAVSLQLTGSNVITINGGSYGGNFSATRPGSGGGNPQLNISGGTFNGTFSFAGPGAQTGVAQVGISGGTFNNTIQTGVAKLQFTVSGTPSYNPPAVVTPAIRSGNYMSFAASAIPPDPGFRAAGGIFNPLIQLAGTSDDILGAGLQ